MLKTAKLTIFILLLTFLTLGHTGPVSAQNTANIQTTQIQGEILRIDDHRIIIETPNQEIKELTVPSGVKIEKNNVDSAYNNLSPGDNITLTQNSNGEVIAVKASSPPLFNLENIALPLLLLLIPLSVLILALKTKPQKNYIRTTGISV